MTFVPTAEPKDTPNAFLTKTPEQAIADGDLADVPLLSGVCEHEMLLGLPSPDYVPDWNDEMEFQVYYLTVTHCMIKFFVLENVTKGVC